MRSSLILAGLSAALPSAAADAQGARRIDLDVATATKPLDRFFDLSVGSDYPGTLIRDDSQAQLKTAVDELGFRYIRFHAIFHDVLGTVKQARTGASSTTGPASTSSTTTCLPAASSPSSSWASRPRR